MILSPPMAIPQRIIEEIRERTSLFDIVSERVALKSTGRNHVGLCPFHSEKTPSFSVPDEGEFYHCFGCGKSGSAFDFVMETRGLTFPEAVRYLGGKAGVDVPDINRSPEEKQQADALRFLREIARGAEAVYAEALFDKEIGRPARQYLKDRGITSETAKTFGVGYAPKVWEFLEAQVQERFRHKEIGTQKFDAPFCTKLLLEIGLLRESKKNSKKRDAHYDTLNGRVVFPITKSDGSPIAFGGRLLEPGRDRPKYINSPESPLYQKRRTLYGLCQALERMRKTRHAYIVEGYMDVLSMHQAGFTETVATCGTAITQEHGKVLRRFIDRATLLFDGDSSGRKAAAHCFEVFLNSGIDLQVVLLPEGEDPDTLARVKSNSELEEFFTTKRVSIVPVFLDQLFGECGDDPSAPSASSTGKVAKKFAALVAQIVNPVERECVLKQGADRLQTSEEALLALVQTSRRTKFSKGGEKRAPEPKHQVIAKPQEKSLSSLFGSPKDSFEAFCRQVLIAVLSAPQLAKIVLECSAAENGVLVRERIPASLHALLEELSQNDFVGVGDLVKTREGLPEEIPECLELRDLLLRHGLFEEGLLEETFQQCRIGGHNPEEVVADMTRTTSRVTLAEKLAVIRGREATASSAEQLAQIAQEKLLARRSYEGARLEFLEKQIKARS